MYNFIVEFARVCKDFALPIFGTFAIVSAMIYLTRRGNFYKALTKLICSSVEYIDAETKKSNSNIKDFQTIKESLSNERNSNR